MQNGAIAGSSVMTGTQYHAVNLLTYSNAKVAFYCKVEGSANLSAQKLEIYSGDGAAVTVINSESIFGKIVRDQSAIPILPIIEDRACEKRFYVFYRSYSSNLSMVLMYGKILTCNTATGLISVVDILKKGQKTNNCI
jgi:hypothetical protein